MSAGFRVFTVMLLVFGAIWMHRFRVEQVEWLLRPLDRPTHESRPAYVSPLDRVLTPGETASVVFRESVRFNLPPESPPDIGFGLEELMPGVYADELRPDEEVGAEEELLPMDDPTDLPADPPADLVSETNEVLYKVGPGESLWKIAEKLLGAGSRYTEIVELNREGIVGDGDDLREGTEIRIPVSGVGEEVSERLKSFESGVDTPVEESSVERLPVLHRVEKDENLVKIANQYFPGDSKGWRRIFNANQESLSSPDLILPGTVLKIPSGSPTEQWDGRNSSES